MKTDQDCDLTRMALANFKFIILSGYNFDLGPV